MHPIELIPYFSLTRLSNRRGYKYQSSSSSNNPTSHLPIFKPNHFHDLENGLRFLSPRIPEGSKTSKRFTVYNGFPSEILPPVGLQPSSDWPGWILGIVMTIFLPFAANKWGPFLQLKNNIDTAVQTVENIVDVVEEVAEEVDKVVDDIADDLPEGGALQKALNVVGDFAEETAEKADLAGDFIDKAQEMEDKLESLFEAANSDNLKKKS